jgi:hypothetical protein
MPLELGGRRCGDELHKRVKIQVCHICRYIQLEYLAHASDILPAVLLAEE